MEKKRKHDFFYNFWIIWYLLVSIDWVWNFIILTASLYDVKGCHYVCLWAMIQIVYITDIVIYVVMRNDIPESCALRCDEGTFYCLVFSLSYVFSAFLILWVRIIYIFNYVGFIRGIRKQGRFKCRKERNLNLEIWKFSVNPNEHRIYS